MIKKILIFAVLLGLIFAPIDTYASIELKSDFADCVEAKLDPLENSDDFEEISKKVRAYWESDMGIDIDSQELDLSKAIKVYDDSDFRYKKELAVSEVKKLSHYWIIYEEYAGAIYEIQVKQKESDWTVVFCEDVEDIGRNYYLKIITSADELNRFSNLVAIGTINHPSYPMLLCGEGDRITDVFLLSDMGKYGVRGSGAEEILSYTDIFKEMRKKAIVAFFFQQPKGIALFVIVSFSCVLIVTIAIMRLLKCKKR